MNELEGSFKNLDSYGLLQVTGPDRERFISGQTTNEVQSLAVGSFNLNSRLDRGGKLKAYFYLLKNSESFFLLVPSEQLEFLKEDMSKFIIMDDVEIEKIDKCCSLFFSSYINANDQYKLPSEFYSGEFGFMPAKISIGALEKNDRIRELSDDYFSSLCLLRGAPVLGLTASTDQLVTDTVVNLSGVSLSKGCFLGQETVAKIETRRGGAYLPVGLEARDENSISSNEKISVDNKNAGRTLVNATLGDDSYALASLLRNYRVDKKDFNFSTADATFNARVHYLPIGGAFDRSNYIDYLFEKAVDVFQNIGNEQAISCFKEVLMVEPTHEDSLESIGVIYGRMELFEEGLAFMDRVLEANPDSIMAHTNKSLFLMRQGKIEEAEEEKAQATVKSFASFGKAAGQKKEEEKLAQEKEAEINRRLGMFQQVLEMDPEDELANYGMADVMFQRGEGAKAIPLLEKVIKNNKTYSVAYLLLGKCYLQIEQGSKARGIFEKGIEIASSRGDLMPANEMQSLLSGL